MSKYTVADAHAAEKNIVLDVCPYCFCEKNQIDISALELGATLQWKWLGEHEKHKEAQS